MKGKAEVEVNPQERREILKAWLEPRSIISVLSLSLAIGGAYFSLRGDVGALASAQAQTERRINAVEIATRQDHDVLIEVRADMKQVRYLLEKKQ